MTLLQRAGGLGRWIALPITAALFFVLGSWLSAPAAPDADSAGRARTEAAGTVWTCAMHPQVRSREPGLCPLCGMDLVPVQDPQTGQAAQPTRVALSERAKALSRVRTAPVRSLGAGSPGAQRHLLGRVDYDETTLRTVTAWVAGRIDRLHVRTTGETVRRGQAIATLYSPEVHAAHQDLIQAKRQLERLGAHATESARLTAQAVLEAARDRLRLLGMPESQRVRMERAQKPAEQVQIRTPFAGTVIERLATEGSYVKTGTGLYRVADLSRLWVQLDAYESDLPLLELGQDVSLSLEALPGEVFQGRVAFVDPVLSQKTRTARVRVRVKNPDRRLRPGMFAQAIVQCRASGAKEPEQTGPSLVIPETAPLFTGRRSVVYVAVPDAKEPTYEARTVRLGPKLGDVYPVLAGLAAGERVVIHGAFMLDADLQLRGGHSMMARADDRSALEGTVPVPDASKPALQAVLVHYLGVHQALASDALTSAAGAASALGKATEALKPPAGSAFRDAWVPIARQLTTHANAVHKADKLDQARIAFRGLSQQIATMLRVFGNPTQTTLRLAHCPMALENQGAEWVQSAEQIENPYFGASMHRCGEINHAVTHGTYLPARSAAQADTAKPGEAGHKHAHGSDTAHD